MPIGTVRPADAPADSSGGGPSAPGRQFFPSGHGAAINTAVHGDLTPLRGSSRDLRLKGPPIGGLADRPALPGVRRPVWQ